jgi:hypothetical protein
MRRTLTLLTSYAMALAFTASVAGAQTIGFKLGSAFSTFSVSEGTTTSNSITGFAGGGHIRFGLTGQIGLQAELLSLTRGSDLRGPGAADDLDIRLEYVEIPLLLHLPLMLAPGISAFVVGGPGVAFEVGCDASRATGQAADCDVVFPRNTTDVGLTAGGGLTIGVGPGALLVEGRYTWGMRDLSTAAGAGSLTVRNRSATFMVGYEIPLGRRF